MILTDEIGRPPSGPPVGDATFDAYCFKHCSGAPDQRDERWMRFFGAIADHIVSGIQPRHVLRRIWTAVARLAGRSA